MSFRQEKYRNHAVLMGDDGDVPHTLAFSNNKAMAPSTSCVCCQNGSSYEQADCAFDKYFNIHPN